ncbi:hypothetical protein [Massilia sp. TSP1-1-2]|uniref:hypothetical protein n=1 Tax=unclassified Massilia TaxID=2609279 RepID=UPI003CEAF4B1
MFSLDNRAGRRILTRSRLFTDEVFRSPSDLNRKDVPGPSSGSSSSATSPPAGKLGDNAR